MKVKELLKLLRKANPEAEIEIDDWGGDLPLDGDFTIEDEDKVEIIIVPQQ